MTDKMVSFLVSLVWEFKLIPKYLMVITTIYLIWFGTVKPSSKRMVGSLKLKSPTQPFVFRKKRYKIGTKHNRNQRFDAAHTIMTDTGGIVSTVS